MYLKEIKDQKDKKVSCYGTLIYIPSSNLHIHFGKSKYPLDYQKSIVSPRILLISTWTDGKYSLPGGSVDKNDNNIIDSINREFLEEIGTSINFTIDDFCFSYEQNNSIVNYFTKITNDKNYFETILSSFHTINREAYINEIFGIVGFPIWIEGPLKGEEYSWKNNIWGFPRHLCFQGGTFTQTLSGSNLMRESLIIILLIKNIISIDLMREVFELCSILCHHFPEKSLPLEPFDEFINRIRNILTLETEQVIQLENVHEDESNEIKRRKIISDNSI